MFSSKMVVLSLAGLMLSATSASAQAADHSAMKMDKTIVDVAVENGSFKTLVAAVQAAGLVETLKGEGPFTVFAPTDEAFARLPAGTVEDLLKPENKEKLQAVLTYHVIAGKVTSTDVAGKKLSAKTVQGGSIDVNGMNGVRVNDAMVTAANIGADNGVIHVIDRVLLPK